MKRLIFYDLDGTLVDTRADIANAVNHMLQEMAAPLLESREVERFVGQGLHHLVKNCLGTDEKKRIEKGSAIYRKYYSGHMLDHTVLYPGVREVLDYFKSRKQAVITNKPNPFSKDILTALGVAPYFVGIVAGDSELAKKPDPEAVLAIMKREKIGAADALLVGDSRIDIETARNAGIAVVVVSHGFAGRDELESARPDAIFRDFTELLETAKKLRW